jgi:TIGR00159 family protein
LPRIEIGNVIEILIISFIVYEILLWIMNSRAWVILRGLIAILGFTVLAMIFNFSTIMWILTKIANIAFVAFIIIFQPELRRALEQLGSGNILRKILPYQETDNLNIDSIEDLIKASFALSSTSTGALIVIEGSEILNDYIRTGIEINGKISSQLLINIFEHNTPLHDGAVIVRGNKIVSATCYLPLSENSHISKALGTRHRAAIGISEVTDSLTIVVSEETGNVSVASRGALKKIKSREELREILSKLAQEPISTNWFSLWKGKGKNEKKINE